MKLLADGGVDAAIAARLRLDGHDCHVAEVCRSGRLSARDQTGERAIVPHTKAAHYIRRLRVCPAQVQSYLGEFTFRCNRRSSDSRALVVRRMIEQAVVAGLLTEAELTFGYGWSRSQGGRS